MFRKTLTIRALTPVHVGSGNNLHQIDFLQESDRFSRYDWDRLIDFLIEKGLMAEFKEFLKGKELKTLTDVKKFLKDKGLELPEEALLYSIPFSCTSGPSQVEEFIKVSGKVYLPGSELKGSLRRALLLYALEKDEILFSFFKRKLKEKFINVKEINSFLEDAVFRPFGGGSYGDLLKFISFSDSSPRSPEEVLEVGKIQIFELTSTGKCSSLKERQKRGSSIFSEVVCRESEFEVIFTFKLEQFLLFKEKGKEFFKKTKEQNSKNYKSRSVFELFSSSGEKTLKNLLKAWSDAEKLSIKVDKTLKSCLEESGLDLGKEEYLIRLGKHEGFLFTTVMPALLRKGEDRLFTKVIQKLILGKKQVSIFPKTRKFLVDSVGEVPLGFCSVEFIQ